MAIEEMFTELPTVVTAQMTDIICAVQGFVGPSNLGLSVQENLQQIYNLFQSTIILYYAGNPNGHVAGTTYQLLWDTVDLELWVATTSGTSSTTVWTLSTNSQSTWIDAVTTPVALVNGYKYVADNGATQTVFNIPAVAAFGTTIEIAGKSSATGGWTITYGTGQSIQFGALLTTVTTGSLTSTNANDYVKLLCTTANTKWNVVGSIGNITIV